MLRARRTTHVLRAGRPPDLLPGPGLAEVWMSVAAPQVWAELQDGLRAFVGRRVSDPHAAEDIAQEVLLRLHRNIDGLRHEDRLDAFAYTIARNAITDHYRARGRAREVPSSPDSLAATIDADPDAAQPSDDPDGRQMLARCLEPLVQQLREPYREALMLTDLGELSQVQAARRTGVSVPGMKARVQRGRAQVREVLAECCDVALDESRRIATVQRTGPCACGAERSAPCSAD
jgi:RNA polymerase sigma-70 factor (ECF subfamily)